MKTVQFSVELLGFVIITLGIILFTPGLHCCQAIQVFLLIAVCTEALEPYEIFKYPSWCCCQAGSVLQADIPPVNFVRFSDLSYFVPTVTWAKCHIFCNWELRQIPKLGYLQPHFPSLPAQSPLPSWASISTLELISLFSLPRSVTSVAGLQDWPVTLMYWVWIVEINKQYQWW